MRWIWCWGGLSLLLLAGLGVYLRPLQPSVVALQLTFDPAAFRAVLAAWQPEGVARFRNHLVPDYALLLCYGAFGYGLVRHTALFAAMSPLTRRLLAGSLPLAAASDALENALHAYLTSGVQQAAPVLYRMAGISASTKFALIGVCLGGVLVAYGRRRAAGR